MAMEELSALPYYGGKNYRSATGTGRWVASMLPYRRVYVDVFGGQLGIYLQRDRSPVEIVNDLDLYIWSWWYALQRYTDELIHMLRTTPNSRLVHDLARERRFFKDREVPHRLSWGDIEPSKEDILQRAVDTYVLLAQGFVSSMDCKRSTWLRRTTNGDGRHKIEVERLIGLSERIRDTQVECCDATRLLKRLVKSQDAVIYCDPPYSEALYGHEYSCDIEDKGEFSDVITQQQGFVAISGYGAEWDHLGWHVYEHEAYATQGHQETLSKRTERLWLNQEPRHFQMRLFQSG